MLTLYLGVETLSILSYVMTSMKRKDSLSTEAGMKYALYGGITAGVMLFGISHLYGIFGSIHFAEIAAAIPALEGAKLTAAIVAFLLFFVGLGYKVAAFPFHMWSPDVYQGSPIPVTAFFSIVPKLAGIAAIVRVSTTLFGGDSSMSLTWIAFLKVTAIMTMTVGNISALNQESVKRMLALFFYWTCGNASHGCDCYERNGNQCNSLLRTNLYVHDVDSIPCNLSCF